MAEIQFKAITKRYPDGFEAVKAIDLDISDGEFMILVGPSGCGKSTALRMIAGLEDITDGDLIIGGERVNDLPPRDRDIAMVFQNYALYPHMTVRDNMGFALKLAKADNGEIDRKVSEAAKILDLEQHLERKPANLSGGQRQRVAMGRAIVRDPKAFLMDEPLSNLDAKLRVQMRTEVARIQRRLGTTMVYVTHDQTEAMTLGDRVAVMRAGLIQQVDTPADLYEDPQEPVRGGVHRLAVDELRRRPARGRDAKPAVRRRRSCRTQLRSQLQGRGRRRARGDRRRPARALRGRGDRGRGARRPDEVHAPRSTSSSRWARSCTPTSTSRPREVESEQLDELAKRRRAWRTCPAAATASTSWRGCRRGQPGGARRRRSSSRSTPARSSCSTPTAGSASRTPATAPEHGRPAPRRPRAAAARRCRGRGGGSPRP